MKVATPAIGRVRHRVNDIEKGTPGSIMKKTRPSSKKKPLKDIKGLIKKYENGSQTQCVVMSSSKRKPLKNIQDMIYSFEKLQGGLNRELPIRLMPNNIKDLVRSSKFRHVTCSSVAKRSTLAEKKDVSTFEVNELFIAIVSKNRFFAALWDDVQLKNPFNGAHAGQEISALKWNHFQNDVLATSGSEGLICIWKIPCHSRNRLDKEVFDSVLQPILSFLHYNGKVSLLRWHPTVKDLLLSVGFDNKIIIWNSGTGKAVCKLNLQNHLVLRVYCISWNHVGSQLCTSSKDGFIRIFDPRKSNIALQFQVHTASKNTQVTFLRDGKLFTSGLTKTSMREIALWDPESPLRPLYKDTFDHGVETFHHIYDQDLGLLYLMAKGSGFRVYELTDSPPYVHFLARHNSSSSVLNFRPMPKSSLDHLACEIGRFVQLDSSKSMIRTASVKVPRRNTNIFHGDLFPDIAAPLPSLDLAAWIDGTDTNRLLPVKHLKID